MKTSAAQYRTITRERIQVTREVATVTDDQWKRFIVMEPVEQDRFLDSLNYATQHTYRRGTEFVFPNYTADDLNRLARRSAYRKIIEQASRIPEVDEVTVIGLSRSSVNGLRSCIKASGVDLKLIQEKTGDVYEATLHRIVRGTVYKMASRLYVEGGKLHRIEFKEVLHTCLSQLVKTING